LDWLADDFVRHGWDHKRLHRMILLSGTWRQVTTRSAELDAVDPENSLLGRMNLRRLEAEEIRDALLSVVERLDQQLGGPSLPVTENSEGKIVLGKRLKRDGIKAGVDRSGADQARRSIYIQVQRKLPLNILATFDLPDMTPNCDLRRPTTVATQSLWFLNDAEIVQLSTELARLLADRHDQDQFQIEQLFVRLFAAPPTEEEMDSCREFMQKQAEQFRALKPADSKAEQNPEVMALATLCQALLGSNRFLYVD
jgi:hypothetical protein